MTFSNINELVGSTRGKINQLNEILDTALSNYRTASEIIDSATDHRQTYLDQLLELNQTISSIVDTHPAIRIDRIWQCATNNIIDIAMEEQQIDGKIK